MDMDSNGKLEVLKQAGEVKVEEVSRGEWLCKHEDAMIKRDNSIMVSFMYMPTREAAINHYYDFVAQKGASILLMPGFTEYRYDGSEFAKVEKI
jgi:hypothetical protein